MSDTASAGARRELPPETLHARTHARSLADIGLDGLARACRDDAGAHAPEPRLGTDPRWDRPVVYSPARAGRLGHDGCVVCGAETCPAVDIVELPPRPGDTGPDHAWLTPNLYPNVYPFTARDDTNGDAPPRGVHLVHWSSRRHERGLPGAPPAEAVALWRQLARAEEFLLHGGDGAADLRLSETGDGHRGHVGIIKNKGSRVGGSVFHDHQQILLSDVEPCEPRLVSGLGAALLRDAPAALTVDEVDGLATTIVPPFMSRPLSAFVVPASATRQPESGHLHHLSPDVLDALAIAIARLCGAIDAVMAAPDAPGPGEPAWNLVVHTGPGRGPLVELRPYTQPLGGYEHLGLYMCEELPETSAARLRDALPS